MTAPMMGGGMPAREAIGPTTGSTMHPTAPTNPAETQTCPKCGEKFPCQEEGATPEGQTEDMGEWLKRTAGPGSPPLALYAPPPNAGPPR